MAPEKPNGGSKFPNSTVEPPQPFRRAPDELKKFYSALSHQHIYITHVDHKPWRFKRNIFIVPVLLNVAVAIAFVLRLIYIGPWYLKLVISLLGYVNEATVDPAALTWKQIIWAVLLRTFTFLLDFSLIIFIWPWPVEFCFGQAHGSPVKWRLRIGFRDKEIYVRRSRAWDRGLGDFLGNPKSQNALTAEVRKATSTTWLNDKTGYLTMNGEWDLDWAAMVHVTSLLDKKELSLETFRQAVVLLYHEMYGWLSLDLTSGQDSAQEERRRQVFLFKDALTAIGKEDLFFRWIEIVQFEASQPGGLPVEKQEALAQRIRDLFAAESIDFDQFWKDSVEGT
jgi:hypothetical protein